MSKKNLLLGLGIGLIISSTMFYIGFGFYDKPNADDNKIIDIDDNEIINRAKDLGMILISEVPSTEPQTLSNEDIISEAGKLGMIFQTEESTENIIETTEAETETTQVESTEAETKKEIVDVRIVPGSPAIKISQTLYELGLVDNADAFLSYMRKNEKSSTIRAGYFKIAKGSSYAEVLKILTTPPK